MRPTTRSERIPLDVLRGFALLGILVINVRYFAGPLKQINSPGQEPQDLWTWFVGTLLFEDKMIAIFSMLFGAGIVLMGMKTISRQFLRNLWLFLIGAAHAYGLWHGDILMVYATCGLLLMPVQRLPGALLAPLAVALVLAGFLIDPLSYISKNLYASFLR